MGAVDVPALLLAIVLSAAITGVLAFFADTSTKRDWIVAGILALVVLAIGMGDLMRETPRETHWATWVFGAPLPVAAGMLALRASRALKRWQRLPIALLVVFVSLFAGLLIGSALLPRYLGA